MIRLLPPGRPLCLEEEVTKDKEDEDNDVNAATANNGNKDMPPKAKLRYHALK
jgi:hypothetical protein